VATLAGSPELRSRLGNAARQMIVDNFTWEGIGRQFLQVVEDREQ
jgi:glycosyltransferase involved in cell wall biosynthesis